MKLASRCGNDEGLAPYGLKPLVQSALGADRAPRRSGARRSQQDKR